jgi:hypothetical protein
VVKDVLIPLAAAFALIVLEAVVAAIRDIREDRETLEHEDEQGSAGTPEQGPVDD